MKSLLTSIPLLVGLVILIVITSVSASLCLSNWDWFQRSGSLIVLVGVLLGTRNMVRRGFDGLFHDATHIDGGHIVPTPEEIEDERQLKLDIKAAQIGVGLAITGTIIWGYGDLLARF